MARPPASRPLAGTTLSAIVRQRAGITQQELGDLLGIGRAQVAHVEAGRRGYSGKAQARLLRLSELLPARALAAAPAPTPPPAAGPTLGEQADLRRRLRHCRRTLAGLAYAEPSRQAMAEVLARRTQALAVLRHSLAHEATLPDPGAETAREAAWLELLELATSLAARRQPTPTALGLRALRRQLLELEIAGLEALLHPPTGAEIPAG